MAEGSGIIIYIEVYNITQRDSYEWDNIDGWLTPLPRAVMGDEILVYAEIQNKGDEEDTIFGEFVSAQVTPNESLIQEGLIPTGEPTPSNWPIIEVEWTFTMPLNNVNIIIKAGHEE